MLSDSTVQPAESSPGLEEELRFPTDAFKGPIGDMGHAVAAAIGTKELVYSMLLPMAGALVRKGVYARNHISGYTTYPNLSVVVGADTGKGKSKTAEPLTPPLFQLEKEMRERAEDWRRKSLAGLARLERESGKRNTPPPGKEAEWVGLREAVENYRPPTLIEVSPTIEGMIQSMAASQGSGFIFATEGKLFLDVALGLYTKGTPRIADLCALFSGDRVGGSRVTRESPQVENPRLTIFLAVQTNLIRFLRKHEEAIERGFVGRTLCVLPSPPRRPDPDSPAPEIPEEIALRYAERCRELFETFGLAEAPAAVRFDEDAAWYLHRLDANHPNWANRDEIEVRQVERISRVALVLHLMEYGKESASVPLSLGTVRYAEAIDACVEAPWKAEVVDLWPEEMQQRRRKLRQLVDDSGDVDHSERAIYRKWGGSRGSNLPYILALIEEGFLDELPPEPRRGARYRVNVECFD